MRGQLFHGDDPTGNIDARLRRNLEVTLYYILEVGSDANSSLVLVLSDPSFKKHPFSRSKHRSISFHAGVIIFTDSPFLFENRRIGEVAK
jgi:predicted ABC-type transport system involved in lysophospholipase L1 biosynthesis ATPase subunit